METKEIQISFIKTFPSVQEGIFHLTGISKSALKRFHFKKSFLQKEIRIKDTISFPINLINHQKINPLYNGDEIKLIFEDKTLMALSKPVRIHSHPLTYHEKDNLLSGLYSLKKYKELLVNAPQYDRGLMYRLDFETSGLMIYLKDESKLLEVRKNFSTLVKTKYYLAVVSGNIESQKLTHKMKSSGVKGAIMQESLDGAISEIIVEQIEFNKDKDISLLKIELLQGHRHQIRAQLSFCGHPIVGDELYGGKKSERLYLHCFEYKFTLNKKEYEIIDANFSKLTEFFNFNG